MPPIDTAPHGGEIMHEVPEPKYPEPKPGQESDEPVRGQPGAPEPGTDVSQRPELPADPQAMAADLEDEEADPVIDIGPGISDGLSSLRKQRG